MGLDFIVPTVLTSFILICFSQGEVTLCDNKRGVSLRLTQESTPGTRWRWMSTALQSL